MSYQQLSAMGAAYLYKGDDPRALPELAQHILSHITAVPFAFEIKRRKPGGLQVFSDRSLDSVSTDADILSAIGAAYLYKKPLIKDEGFLKRKATTYSPT